MALAIVVGAQAAAHQLWLEREGTVVRAYFGEPMENLREPAGGLLDRITAPRIFVSDVQQGLPTRRTSNAIEAIVPEGVADVRLVEDSIAPFGRDGDRTKPVLLAREGRTDVESRMELELVPVAPGATRFTLRHHGHPVPRAEVTVVAPPRWERRLRTDSEGTVQIETPWAGRYVLEAIHLDATPGEVGGIAFVRRRLVSTLSFTTTQGIAWAGR